jgi:hypothetical protein
MDLDRQIAENLARVDERIAQACERVGRARAEVTLVAVTKTRSAREIVAAYRAGARHLGENRVEELATKRPALDSQLPLATWHMIGHLQSRKAREAVELADVLHSVDTLKLAQRLNRFAIEADCLLPIFLELNVSGEESKAGFAAATGAQCDALVAELQGLAALEHLVPLGLMTMAPIVATPEQARPYFCALRALRDRLRAEAPFCAWNALSMGMTDDYVVAIEEGATHVRIGRAIFEAHL